MLQRTLIFGLLFALVFVAPFGRPSGQVWGQSPRLELEEITPESEVALERGLDWLARNQGPEGNWGSNDLGLVGMGALAFLSAGHAPGRGKFGREVDKALEF